MLTLDHHPTGRHFLQIPGPSPVPDRILRAMSLPTIDHRGPEFGALGRKVLAGIQQVFQTKHPVVIYPASAPAPGRRRWQHAEPGRPGADGRDRPLRVAVGQDGRRLGCRPRCWPAGDDPSRPRPTGAAACRPTLIEARLRPTPQHAIKAVCVVHNETSTGVTSDIAAVRRAIDAPATRRC
jgi:alanine-glyoxylate transaminase/serine-glyoxylate transaminase/serine-pyruvate transaminase